MGRADRAAVEIALAPALRFRQLLVRGRFVEASPHREALQLAERSFLHFLPHWKFLDRETGEERSFKEVWPGQRRFAGAAMEHDWLYALKAGKLGFTELECAFDGWVLRFRQPNARVHVFSRTGDAAVETADIVRYGMDHLPVWMALPKLSEERGGDTGDSTKWYAGPNDTRTLKAYTASPNVSIEQTCQHAHVDELARMQYGERLWTAVQSTVAPEGGTCHIVTRGAGPNFAGTMFRRALQGQSRLHPFFAGWDERPDRDAAWYETQTKEYTAGGALGQFAPKTWEEALSGAEGYVLDSELLDAAAVGAWGPVPHELGQQYCSFWDIGRHHDAAVGVTLCYSSRPWQVVAYERYRGLPFPTLQERIVHNAREYQTTPFIEGNGPGEAVAENLGIKAHTVSTTGKSKPMMITTLQWMYQQGLLRYDPEAWPQLDLEQRGYMWDDKELVQDSVIATSGAVYWAGREGEEEVSMAEAYKANLSSWDR